MRYIDFRNKLKAFTVFSLADMRKLEYPFRRRALNEWQEKGYIKKVVRGYYVFTDMNIDENALFKIANSIYQPSYVSVEMALSRYGLIPETVYGITSVTTLRTRAFRSDMASFVYRTVQPKLFFGYSVAGIPGTNYNIASFEKAILDYLYLNPSINDSGSFEAARFDADSYREGIDEDRFKEYLDRFENSALSKRACALMRYMKNA